WSCSVIARGSLPKAAKARLCSGTAARTATPPGDAPDMDSTVVSPNGMSSQPSPMGGTFGVPMSCDTDRMRPVDYPDGPRVPAGDTPLARWVRPRTSRSLVGAARLRVGREAVEV